jgi:hypothetical protein
MTMLDPLFAQAGRGPIARPQAGWVPKREVKMKLYTRSTALAAASLLLWLVAFGATAQTAPAAPTLAAPSSGAALAQPIVLDWNAVSDPDGPIGSYTWQVSTTSSFGTIVLAGFTNQLSDDLPAATQDKVSGLPNGTYFWRVKATQLVGGATGSIDSPWSAVRSFNVTGLGPAPARPTFTAPASGASFHVREFFDITWSPVPGAQYYVLEADTDAGFSYPLTLTTDTMTFGTRAEAGWGNAIADVYYRIRAVSADNVRGLPSATLRVHITNAAPVPPAPALLAPANGATVSLPFRFDWSDTPNPQVPGYDVDVDTDPSFAGSFGVLLLQGVTRSDYMLASDLAPGTYFWRVRALHGDVFGPWSASRSFKVVAAPPSPPDAGLFAIIAEPGNAYGGNSTQARVMLNEPAPPGGAMVSIASDIPQAEGPQTVIVPGGKTDATVSPITTRPAPPNGIIGTVRAAYAGEWQQSSLGVLPLLYGTSLSHESVVGGTSFTGTITLQSAAPPGGATVRLVSSDTGLARLPATVFIPEGATDATFTVATSAVSTPTRVVIETGMDLDGYRAPQAWITLTPPGTATPAPSLASLVLNPSRVASGQMSTGTVTLTSPAPAGGAVVKLQGSMEGRVVTPASVTVPAGSLSTDFTITAPPVWATHWVFIGGQYGTSGGSQARLLQIDPGPPGAPTLLAMGASASDVIGGDSFRGTIALVVPAPPGGGAVSLTSENPGVVQVPASVTVAEGNSTGSFIVTTSRVPVTTGVRINASAGGETRSWFVNVTPSPDAPPLLAGLTLSPTSVAGGSTSTGTVFLSAPAPANGITVTLSTNNLAVAKAPGVVAVPAGQTSASFTVTTSPVSADTSATITASFDSAQSATLVVTRAATPPPAAGLSSVGVSPSSVIGGSTSQGKVTLTSAAPSGGAIVSLVSSNTAVASVPASVTVASGATSATFTIATRSVTSATSATISANYNGAGRNATLTVNPASTGSLAAPTLTAPASDARFAPGQNVTFDWSDVSGAASYTIQIDDQDTLASPFIVNQAVAVSQFSTSTLPTKRMWWRVRANDASGNPGIWSSIRRFEVKD